ncbi:hypothetical protein B0J12DRAFT_111240 [Macrophomina phaseolina]|uniref:Uncharacterized protein n=1 Tax=Macrophomina phaseolina TaxID=35725 RepID=A0ABQ8G8L4_9PEZI|nr:hypothetical protein B0J12DRAFT_111240 [Macrophomina phaseolina]
MGGREWELPESQSQWQPMRGVLFDYWAMTLMTSSSRGHWQAADARAMAFCGRRSEVLKPARGARGLLARVSGGAARQWRRWASRRQRQWRQREGQRSLCEEVGSHANSTYLNTIPTPSPPREPRPDVLTPKPPKASWIGGARTSPSSKSPLAQRSPNQSASPFCMRHNPSGGTSCGNSNLLQSAVGLHLEQTKCSAMRPSLPCVAKREESYSSSRCAIVTVVRVASWVLSRLASPPNEEGTWRAGVQAGAGSLSALRRNTVDLH